MNRISFKEDDISKRPAIELLKKLGYQYISPDEALAMRGGKYSNVLLEEVLRRQLRELNSIRIGSRKEARFSEQNIENGVIAMRNVPMEGGYLSGNEAVYNMLTLGKAFEQSIDGDKKSYTMRYIDWEHPENNVYHVTEEFTVARTGTSDTYRPDIVLFVNGIPLVVIECKRPDINGAEEQAISQHLRNQQDDGIRGLYVYSSLLLAIGNNFETDQQYLKLYSKPNDPLADFKAALSAKIARANMYNGVAYTTASFNALTAEIITAQAALDAAVSKESLTTATTNLQAKIDALELAEGYSNLTKDMMFSWSGWGAEAVKGAAYGSCAYVLFESTGQPYGDPSVNAWADLSSYEKLVVVATGTPRFLLNRDADNGQWNADEAQSHLIDNTAGDANSWHAQYFSQEGNVYTVDLAKLTTNKGFAYLNAIKAKSNITVSGMYLYRTPDPLQAEKDALLAAIALGKAKNTFARTTASVTALSDAISDGQAELENKDATAESLTAATSKRRPDIIFGS